MKPEDLSPAMQAQLEAVLQRIILWGTRIVAPQLLALDWLIAHQLELGLPARMRRVHDQVMEALRHWDTSAPPRAGVTPDEAFAARGISVVEVPHIFGDDDHSETECDVTTPPDPLDNPTMDGVVWMCPTKEEAAAWGNRPWQIRAGFDGTHIDHLPTEWLAGHDAIYRPVRNVLDWPEMDGERWLDSADVTQDMIDAWPGLWDIAPHEKLANRVRKASNLAELLPRHTGKVRPLRFPGQDPITGIVEGPDMTPEHFSGVWESRYFRSLGYGWSSWVPSNIKSWDLTMGARVQFRPVGWPEPTERTPASRAPFDTDRMRRVHARVMANSETAVSENPLDWPVMDGETWTDAKDVTREMIHAWPIWDTRHRSRALDNGHRLSMYLIYWVNRQDWEWRPLRLPGQDPVTGIVDGLDMTPEHFGRLRVTGWCVRSWREPEWRRASLESDCTGVGQEWRPVGWPESSE